ncbi:hypothetical protein ACH5RR_026116 [Cinchona calisaya]|uniref:Uncharacterized protein n=1 Tax=Cinchona calisaya TaxID=153742 RepID=A0ABD2Z3U3_9GENT
MNPRENASAITLRSGKELPSPSVPSSLLPNEEEESKQDKTNSAKVETPQPKVISKPLNSSFTNPLPFPEVFEFNSEDGIEVAITKNLIMDDLKDPKGTLALKEQ